MSRLTEKLSPWLSPRYDFLWVLLIGGLSFLTAFDLLDMSFRWWAFHERDFSKTVSFLMGDGLSHLGPESSEGGYLPGPFLTLLYAVPVFLFQSPRAIHGLIQLSFVASLFLTFFLVRRHFNRPIAYLTLALLLSSANFVNYAYLGWHASFVLAANLLILAFFDLYWRREKTLYLLAAGVAVGLGLQVHFTILILYAFYLVWVGVCWPRRWLKVLGVSLAGVFLTLAYYLTAEMGNGFQNTLSLISDLESKRRIFLSAWQHHGGALWAYYVKNVFYMRSGLLTLLLLGVAGWALGRRTVGAVPYHLWIRKAFLLASLLLLPAAFFTRIPRYYLLAHPAYEVLLALGVFVVFQVLKKTLWPRVLLALFLGGVVLVNGATVRDNFVFYKQGPYSHSHYLKNAILNDLKLSPEEYENRFYLFRGEEVMPLFRSYELPSHAHYRMAWSAQLHTDSRAMLEREEGLVLVETEDLKSGLFNSDALGKFRWRSLNGFTALIYQKHYLFRQQKVYSEILPEEEAVRHWTGPSLVVKGEGNPWVGDAYFEVEAKRKTFRYRHRLKIEEAISGGLAGFTEVLSADLRQSETLRQSPYFLRNPQVEIRWKDGSEPHVISILNGNFYSHVKARRYPTLAIFPRFYDKYGDLSDSLYLGAGYVEAPFGASFHVPEKRLSDIDSVVWRAEGYGSIEVERDDADDEVLERLYRFTP